MGVGALCGVPARDFRKQGLPFRDPSNHGLIALRSVLGSRYAETVCRASMRLQSLTERSTNKQDGGGEQL